MTAKQRQNLLAVLAIGGITLLAVDRFLLTPLTASWKARSQRLATLEQSINQGELLQQRDQAIRDRWESIRTNTLPTDVSEAENQLLKAFERWAQDSKISISSIKPQWRTHDDYMTLDCRADAFGSLPALTRFLYDLEQDPLALKIEGIEITTRDNDGQSLALALEVSGLKLSPAKTGSL